MHKVAQRYQDRLDRLKSQVRKSHDYFKPNYDRFNEFRRFVFESCLTADEITLLQTLSRPQLEFNVLEAYISRLIGEFSKHEPDIMVLTDDQERVDPLTIKVVEQHLRHVMLDPQNHNTRHEVYKDLLSGGFSALKITTDYENPMSMNQVINIERVYDPTLVGFDPLAKYSHKGDGRYCFEMFPMSEEDFKEEYPDIKTNKLSFRRDFEGFGWSYQSGTTKILLVVDFYEKKYQETQIVQMQDGKTITLDKYNKMIENWDKLELPPKYIGKPRKTKLEKIVRYRLIENEVIEYQETDFSYLPIVFVDGSSITIKSPTSNDVRQVTRPYVYHAKGAQRLKNYAGISLANEIENTIQHKFMVAKEAIPKEDEFQDAYKNVQKASTLVFNSVHESNPELPIANPIREIQRAPAPPEIINAFQGTDSLIQNVLGSYDASLGINDNQLSGIAIIEAATQSNAAAMPYIIGYLEGWQRACQIYVDLLPKYYVTPRTIPVLSPDGAREYIKINQEDGLPMDFDTNVLNVIVKAGPSFQVQKQRTLMMVKEMMGMSPLFQQFMAEKGLPFILDNMEGRGIDELKKLTEQWTAEYEQQKQQAMQQQQNDPAQKMAEIKMAELQQKAQRDQAQFSVDMAKLEVERQKVIANAVTSESSTAVQALKAQTERYAKNADLAIKHMDMQHKHTQVYHKLHQEQRTQ